MARNSNRRHRINRLRQYRFSGNRAIARLRQYTTPILTNITIEDRQSINKKIHIWKTGDKFYKLAAKHYGDPTLWWIIAWYNTAPTEAHVRLGDRVYIPLPLERVLSFMRVY